MIKSYNIIFDRKVSTTALSKICKGLVKFYFNWTTYTVANSSQCLKTDIYSTYMTYHRSIPLLSVQILGNS